MRAALDGGGGDGADRDERRADHDRGIHAIDELLTGAVAALAGEDRGEHGDAEHAAELADRVVGARCLSFLFTADGRQDDVGDGREEQRHANAREGERADELGVGGGGRRDRRDPGKTDGL